MTALPLIRDTLPGIYQVCAVANRGYTIAIPAGALGAVLWFETSASNATLIGGRIGLDEANTRIGTENVATSGGPLPGAGVAVTFTGALGNTNVALMTATSSLTGGTTPAVVVTETTAGGPGVNEVQTVTITGAPTGGTFTLTYGGQTTAAIAYNATAAAVETALEALTSITGITGTDNLLGYHPAMPVEYDLTSNRAVHSGTTTTYERDAFIHVACATAGAVVRGMWLYANDATV